MKTLYHFFTPPGTCGYLPEQTSRMEYEVAAKVSREEYQRRLKTGWRRFGYSLFRPACASCQACQSIRVVVDRFHCNRNQRRVRLTTGTVVTLTIGEPAVTDAKLQLYDRYHAFQQDFKDWPAHAPMDADSYAESFVDNPFPTQEWCYFVGDKLVGVGYVDALAQGLSAIYFFYDPDYRYLSLGTWNVLSIIERAARQRLPHVYLGYYVAGCRSMEYKATYRPNEVLGAAGSWSSFRP